MHSPPEALGGRPQDAVGGIRLLPGTGAVCWERRLMSGASRILSRTAVASAVFCALDNLELPAQPKLSFVSAKL